MRFERKKKFLLARGRGVLGAVAQDFLRVK
jgi:hypothetical protein